MALPCAGQYFTLQLDVQEDVFFDIAPIQEVYVNQYHSDMCGLVVDRDGYRPIFLKDSVGNVIQDLLNTYCRGDQSDRSTIVQVNKFWITNNVPHPATDSLRIQLSMQFFSSSDMNMHHCYSYQLDTLVDQGALTMRLNSLLSSSLRNSIEGLNRSLKREECTRLPRSQNMDRAYYPNGFDPDMISQINHDESGIYMSYDDFLNNRLTSTEIELRRHKSADTYTIKLNSIPKHTQPWGVIKAGHLYVNTPWGWQKVNFENRFASSIKFSNKGKAIDYNMAIPMGMQYGLIGALVTGAGVAISESTERNKVYLKGTHQLRFDPNSGRLEMSATYPDEPIYGTIIVGHNISSRSDSIKVDIDGRTTTLGRMNWTSHEVELERDLGAVEIHVSADGYSTSVRCYLSPPQLISYRVKGNKNGLEIKENPTAGQNPSSNFRPLK
jgi:hypothetical protein